MTTGDDVVIFLRSVPLVRGNNFKQVFFPPGNPKRDSQEKIAFSECMRKLKALVQNEAANLLERLNMADSKKMEVRAKIICAETAWQIFEFYPDEDDINKIYGKCKEFFGELTATHEKLIGATETLCEYLKAKGQLYFSENMIRDTFINLIVATIFGSGRDNLPAKKLFEIDTCEHILAKEIERGMAAELTQHEIYEACKTKLDEWKTFTE